MEITREHILNIYFIKGENPLSAPAPRQQISAETKEFTIFHSPTSCAEMKQRLPRGCLNFIVHFLVAVVMMFDEIKFEIVWTLEKNQTTSSPLDILEFRYM